MEIAGIIPARYGSVRFPGKPLALLDGRPLVLHVLDRARESRRLTRALVATDDERIAEVVRADGGDVAITSPDCATGSDRLAEVARNEAWDVVVNLQGDEPRLAPEVIDAVIDALLASPDCGVATASVPIRDEADFLSPHVVKAVADERGRALYFSRSPVPSPARLTPEERAAPGFVWGWKHLGLYAYRRQVLLDFTTWPQSPLEQRERLEQLRLMEHGVGIRLVTVEHDSPGIDTPEELEKLNAAAASNPPPPLRAT